MTVDERQRLVAGALASMERHDWGTPEDVAFVRSVLQALASRPQEQPRKATGEMVEAASRAVVAEWRVMLQEVRGAMSAAEIAQGFVSPGNFRLIRAALNAALSVSPAAAQGWQYVTKPQPSGDCRKIVTLDEDGMTWVGIRAFDHQRQIWLNNNEPEKARILAWRDLDEPARGRWVGGRLYPAADATDVPADGLPKAAAPPSPAAQEQEKGEQT